MRTPASRLFTVAALWTLAVATEGACTSSPAGGGGAGGEEEAFGRRDAAEEEEPPPPPRRNPEAPADAAAPVPDEPGPPAPAPRDASVIDRPPARDAAAAQDIAFHDAPPGPVVGGESEACHQKVCEGFESYAEGPVPKGKWVPTGNVSISSTLAARGKKALHVLTGTEIGEQFIRTTQTLPWAAGEIYGRFFMRVEKQPQKFVHWTAVEGSGQRDSSGKVVRYGGIVLLDENSPKGSKNTFFFNLEPRTKGVPETGSGEDTRIPLQTWHCIEFFFSTPKSEARFWWNGVERPKLHWTAAAQKPDDERYLFPAFKALSFGLATYQAVEAGFDVYLDEIALDDKRVGCE